MPTRLIITRHGNTFSPGQTHTRVGARTDLPLVEDHRARSIGKFLKENNYIPQNTFSGPLKRHTQTAQYIIEELNISSEITVLDSFSEIDYGPDENQTEDYVINRIGQLALDAWDKEALVPNGWIVNPHAIIQSWHNFADHVARNHKDQNTLLVSSNGIIRFAPHILGNFQQFAKNNTIKIPTGGLSIFEKYSDNTPWQCTQWALKPYKQYPQ